MWKKYNPNPTGRSVGDCAIRAVAKALSLTWEEAYALIVANGFAGVEQGANARQIANMQTAFAAQTAQAQGFNAVQSQLAQCCCDNRLATQQLQAVVQQIEQM